MRKLIDELTRVEREHGVRGVSFTVKDKGKVSKANCAVYVKNMIEKCGQILNENSTQHNRTTIT